jgi:rubrerythrin
MASKLIARRHKQTKKATTLVSKQSLEQAIQEGNALVDQLILSDVQDERLDQLEKAISFLSSVLKKSPIDMQQEGAATLEDYLDDAVMPEMAQQIKQDVDMIAKLKNAGHEVAAPAAPVMASGSDNWVSDRDEDGKAKTPELAEVPRLANNKKAAPAVPAPAPAVAKPGADITKLNSDTLAKIQKALAGTDDLMNDKAAQAFIVAIGEELMNRPVETEAPEAPAAPAVAPPVAGGGGGTGATPIAASLVGGLSLAAADEDDEEEEPKTASAQGGSWFVNDGKGQAVLEDGGRTPEIAKAHAEQDDKTGIKVPATESVTKFAGDMTTGKAVKMTETLGNQLKTLYLDAKKVTEVLDTRPVREAVESIFRAYDLMGEATKVLNKQKMQEEAEEKATEIKESNKKKSSLFGLSIAAAEDEDDDTYICEGCGKPHEYAPGGMMSEMCQACTKKYNKK